MSVQLQSISSAVFCQSSCNLSALAYSVMQFICCDRPATRPQLSYEVQAPLQSVISVATCLLSHDLSPWQQSVSSVCQLSCNTAAQLQSVCSVQLSCYLKAQLQLVNSSCQLSCSLSARLHPVNSDETCHLSCKRLAELKSVSSFVLCPLGCSVSAQTCSVSLGMICQFNGAAQGHAQIAQMRSFSSAQLPLVHFAVSSVQLISLTVSSAAPCS